jgi:hypothetical protein
MLEKVITTKAFPFMKPEVARAEDGSIYLDLNSEGELEVKGWLQGWLQDANFIYTPEEISSVKKRQTLLAEARLWWGDANPDKEFSIAEFSMLEEVRSAYDLYPDITEDEKSKRFLDHFSNTFRQYAKEFLEDKENLLNFNGWLTENYSLEDDFKTWLQYFPEREHGSHNKHAKKAYLNYLVARRKFAAGDLRILAGEYWDKLDREKSALSFAKLPENWLADLVAESKSSPLERAF